MCPGTEQERECTRLSRTLERTEDFIDMGDQERFDTCEGVMSEVLRGVRAVATEWKVSKNSCSPPNFGLFTKSNLVFP